MLVKFEQIRMVKTTRNLGFFDKKTEFFKTIFGAILKNVSVADTICLMLNN